MTPKQFCPPPEGETEIANSNSNHFCRFAATSLRQVVNSLANLLCMNQHLHKMSETHKPEKYVVGIFKLFLNRRNMAAEGIWQIESYLHWNDSCSRNVQWSGCVRLSCLANPVCSRMPLVPCSMCPGEGGEVGTQGTPTETGECVGCAQYNKRAFHIGDARSFSGLSKKIPPLGSMVKF